MYADNLVIYYKANISVAKEVTNCLETYYQWTGQQINWRKSSIHFSRNVRSQLRGEITWLMNLHECLHWSKYLGHPFCQLKSKIEAYQKIGEKLANKLTGWRQRTLSMACRLVLAKAVAETIPAYTMQVIMLPKSILMRMDNLIRNFLWGHREDKAHHMHLKAWDTIYQNIKGDLGLEKCRLWILP